jgi:hypothetical protein
MNLGDLSSRVIRRRSVPDDKRAPAQTLDETLAPIRNFTITTADRVRAAAGPPAYIRRKRHIEDLRATLEEQVAGAIARAGGDVDAARRDAESNAAVVKSLRELDCLIVAHNRYYPIEANLPLDPTTRVQLDRGRPWQPLPTVTLRDVFAGVLSACGAASHVGKIV